MSMPTDGTGQRSPVTPKAYGSGTRDGTPSHPASMPTGDTGQQSRPRSHANDDSMDGQHRTYGVGHPGEQTGQTSHARPGANVGQQTGSGGWNVPAVDKSADIPAGTATKDGKL